MPELAAQRMQAALVEAGHGVGLDPFAEHIRFATRYAGLSTECEGAALAMPRLPTA